MSTARTQCEAVTQAGERCRLPARPGSRYCHIHQRAAAAETPSAPVSAPAETAPPQPAVEPEPEARPPLLTFSAEEVLAYLRDKAQVLPEELRDFVLKGIDEIEESGWLDADTWRGIGYVLQVAAQTQLDMLKRRLRGEYEVDAWGYDPEFTDYILPLAGFFFNKYWRVEMNGLDHIPVEGRALMVANHSGILPLDGAMISYGVREYHPAHRLVRALVADWFPTLPFFSLLLTRTGQVLAHPDNGRRLLEQEELVLVFPEGYKGVGKHFRDRYKLARFGRGGFVRMAIEARAPIIPVSVVGAEETYPLLYNLKPLARLLGFPYFPITPTFPWLGPLGLIPLPTKWFIDIGEPIDTSQYDSELAANPAFVSDITDLVRTKVQEQIDGRLARRKSVFSG
ncbi:MAG: acyltransferase family protein [Caldilineae bacterium]|nr:MAG: acyltransferase family protein [Caldilineae bacterium]